MTNEQMIGKVRTGRASRSTNETQVTVELTLNGSGQIDIVTGVGFLDHMLTALGFHAGFDLHVRTEGDLEVDDHHTVEDTALTLGEALAQALGDKAGIRRFGHAYAPLDEALARVVVDVSGRPHCSANLNTHREKVGD
ncbi:MAG: imidazoleglycerol-phosphate dehydratase, partial [Longimicrobiales bacterium]